MPKILIYIDSREERIRRTLGLLPPKDNITFKELPAGDIVFLTEEQDDEGKKIVTPFCVWERKALDLANAGHFREQRSRLIDWRKTFPHIILILLIEGDLNVLLSQPNITLDQRKQLENLVNDLGPKFNIGRLTSNNVMDTIRLIGRYENIFREEGPTADIIAADSVVKHLFLGRKRGLVQGEWAICALSMIKGVSRETAMEIGKAYTLKTLHEAYVKCPSTKARENLIRNMDIGVGATRSRRIYHYMMDIEDEPSEDDAEDVEIVEVVEPEKITKKSAAKGKGRSRSPKRKSTNLDHPDVI